VSGAVAKEWNFRDRQAFACHNSDGRSGTSLRDRDRRLESAAAMPSMHREYWKTALREALVELDSARGKTATDAAARRVMRARTELKLLGAPKRPKRRATRALGAAGAS
jgi:hypothetical protein